jgi:hypothetical protein
MKPSYAKILSISIILAAGISCSKSSNSSSSTCTASTGDALPLTSNQAVSYTASVTTGATISTISYQDSAGMTTLNKPSVPFSKTVNLKSGSTASITASGTTNSGKITVTSNGINFNTASCP